MAFKLYYTPTSCGAASFITATLADLTFDSEQVGLMTKKTASGADFLTVNPKGNVPTLVLADGTMLNENIATLCFLADQNPAAGLAPAEGSVARYVFLNKLGFVNSELHTGVGKLFSPHLSEEQKAGAVKFAMAKIATFTEKTLGKGNAFVMGDKPTAADIYAYIVLSWCTFLGVPIAENADAVAFVERVRAYPGVKEAHDKMNAAPSA